VEKASCDLRRLIVPKTFSTVFPEAILIRNLQEYGRPPLSRAAERRHEAVVQPLPEKGANIDAKAKNGEAVLHKAAENGHKAVVRLLLEKGANVDTKGPSRRRGRRMLYDSLSGSGGCDGGREAEPRASPLREKGSCPVRICNRDTGEVELVSLRGAPRAELIS
jgi:hypothetical protein